jgi:hypothetical protein
MKSIQDASGEITVGKGLVQREGVPPHYHGSAWSAPQLSTSSA